MYLSTLDSLDRGLAVVAFGIPGIAVPGILFVFMRRISSIELTTFFVVKGCQFVRPSTGRSTAFLPWVVFPILPSL